MITLAIIIVVSIIVSYVIYEYSAVESPGFCSSAFFLVALTAFFLISPWVTEDKTDVDPPRELAILNDHNGIKGRFSLFGGYIEDEPAYTYYEKRSDGGYELRRVEADNAVIYEDTENEAYLVVEMSPALDVTKWTMVFGAATPRYEFHVPKGSVQPEGASPQVKLDGE